VEFYKLQSLQLLEKTYVNRNKAGYNKLIKDLWEEFEKNMKH